MNNFCFYFLFLVLITSCGGGEGKNQSDQIQSNYAGYILSNDLYIKDNSLYLGPNFIMTLNNKILVDIIEFQGSHFIFWYNSEENVASGQKLQTEYVGLELSIVSEGFNLTTKNLFITSSFESIFKQEELSDSFIMCSNQECYRFFGNGNFINLKVTEFTNLYDINSIDFSENKLFLELVRKYPAQNLHQEDGTIYDRKGLVFSKEFVLIEGPKDISDSEFNFGNSTSINNFNYLYAFQDNSEGRIVWGQKYLLDALLLKENLNDLETKILNESLDFYMSFSDINFLFSKRYSFNRQSQIFLLHISRYYNLLTNLKNFLNDEHLENFNLQISLLEKLLLFDTNDHQSVEILRNFDFFEIGIRRYLVFREDSDFWANSVNVPINYSSDYIIALLNINSNASNDLAKSLLDTNFILLDRFEFPSWRYWSGAGLTGWNDVNINTPIFTGELNSPYAADIIYRSTDAESFLKACNNPQVANQLSFDCQIVNENLLRFISSGSLEPHLLEYFENYELTENIILNIKNKFQRNVYISDLKNSNFVEKLLRNEN